MGCLIAVAMRETVDIVILILRFVLCQACSVQINILCCFYDRIFDKILSMCKWGGEKRRLTRAVHRECREYHQQCVGLFIKDW